jgi:pSer/pThr/pTyr-binding forkhead associated (FHA) protein
MGFRLRYQSQEIALAGGAFTVGRTSACELTLSDPLVSRKHAQFVVSGADLTVEDLGSRNGVVVNGTLADGPTAVFHGDRVLIGAHELLVLVDSGSESGRAHRVVPTMPKMPAAAAAQARPASSAPAARFAPPPLAPMRVREADTGSEPPPSRPTEIIHDAGRLGDARGPDSRPPDSEFGTIEAHIETSLEHSMLRRADLFRVLGVLAEKSLALGRAAEAERLLASALTDVIEASRSGKELPVNLVDDAAKYSAKLAAATGKGGWADYVLELYLAQKRPLPTPVISEFAAALRRISSFEIHKLKAFLETMRDNPDFGPAEQFLLQRLEGVLRAHGGSRA